MSEDANAALQHGKTTQVADMAIGLRAMLAAVEKCATQMAELDTAWRKAATNKRPWHKHTLPSRRRT